MTDSNGKETGGAAFPTTQYANGVNPTGHDHGMTLRDYFAAKAMQSLFNNPDITDTKKVRDWIAIISYEIADSMLKARKE